MRLFESSFPYIYRYFSIHLKSKMPVLECMIVTQVEFLIYFLKLILLIYRLLI